MRSALALPLPALLLPALVACGVTDQALDPLPLATECACVASDGSRSCPTTVCDLQIEIDPVTCKGKVEQVEVMIDDRLEPHIWKLGTPFRTCATVPRGGSVALFARADTPWQWRSAAIDCVKATGGQETNGPTIIHKLQCLQAR